MKNVGIIKADVDNPVSLTEMAKQGKIVLNCVGPYRLVKHLKFSLVYAPVLILLTSV